MSILDIKNLSHFFDGKTIFSDASLSVNNGEHAGIVGLNGAGKSTFMNIIAGRIFQDEGEVLWLSGIRFGYLDQHATLSKHVTVMDYLKTAFDYLYEKESALSTLYDTMGDTTDADELDRLVLKSANMQEYLERQGFYELDSLIKKVASGLGVNNFGFDTEAGKLSGGQRAKLMLAKLLLEKPDVMLLDEPTNFLDLEHIEWLKEYLNAYSGTFLLISHDTAFLNAVCRQIISVENRQIKKYTGNYDKFLSQHEQNARQYADSYERQQQQIKDMETYIAKNSARAATAGMANSRKKMLARMEVMEKPVETAPAHFSFPVEPLNTRQMLEVETLKIGYNGHAILPPITFTVSGTTKLWIRGTNGLGKTTLLKTLMRVISPIGGRFDFHIGAKINYIEQDLDYENPSATAVEYFQSKFPRMSLKDIRGKLGAAGIVKELATKPLKNMSGGEQVKVKLASLCEKTSNILILDEPTNHLDVLAKEALKNALEAYSGTVILVSHEPEFAESVCNDVFDLAF